MKNIEIMQGYEKYKNFTIVVFFIPLIYIISSIFLNSSRTNQELIASPLQYQYGFR